MQHYRNDTHKFLSNLSDEEFYGLLEESGFEVEEGDGKIILTDEEEVRSMSIQFTSSFSLKQSTYIAPGVNKTSLNNTLPEAC